MRPGNPAWRSGNWSCNTETPDGAILIITTMIIIIIIISIIGARILYGYCLILSGPKSFAMQAAVTCAFILGPYSCVASTPM